MKKSLLAMALMGGIASAASAQTNVTIYGIVDVGLNHVNDGKASVTRMDSGILNGSRIGFRGSEDLGGGMAANFQLENGFSTDDGTLRQGGRLWGRRSWVGLSGDFGAIRLGRQDNPVHTLLDAIDPFGTGLTGNIENFFNSYDSRSDNVVSYLTPTIGGFFGQISYGLGEVPGSTATGRLLAGMAGYKSGPLNVQIAYHNQNVADTNIGIGNDKTTTIGGVYDFKVLKLHMAYAWNKGNRLGEQTTDSNDMMLGVTVPVGARSNVLASVLHKKSKLDAHPTSTLLALGYTYALSKRTTLYTAYGRNTNSSGGTLGPDGIDVDPNATGSSINLGIQHRF